MTGGTGTGQAWLSLTPEPERELPAAMATLRAGGAPGAEDAERERERVERLVLRGTQRSWLAYLHEAVELIEASADAGDPSVVAARDIVAQVVHNHHQMLLGLPGKAAEDSADDRARLESVDHNQQSRVSNGGTR